MSVVFFIVGVQLRLSGKQYMLKQGVLRKKEDFNRIYKKGRSAGDRYVVLFCIKNGLDINRTAYLASKKVGNSVKRNRARRLMRESMRIIAAQADVCSGYSAIDRYAGRCAGAGEGLDLILIARNTINGKKCADVKKSIEAAMKKLSRYK